MIDLDSLEHIGVLGKPHGVQGECNARLTADLSTLFEEEERLFLFFELDALPVPFRLIGYREKTDDITLLRFAGIESKEEILSNSPGSISSALRYSTEKVVS